MHHYSYIYSNRAVLAIILYWQCKGNSYVLSCECQTSMIYTIFLLARDMHLNHPYIIKCARMQAYKII